MFIILPYIELRGYFQGYQKPVNMPLPNKLMNFIQFLIVVCKYPNVEFFRVYLNNSYAFLISPIHLKEKQFASKGIYVVETSRFQKKVCGILLICGYLPMLNDWISVKLTSNNPSTYFILIQVYTVDLQLNVFCWLLWKQGKIFVWISNILNNSNFSKLVTNSAGKIICIVAFAYYFGATTYKVLAVHFSVEFSRDANTKHSGQVEAC